MNNDSFFKCYLDGWMKFIDFKGCATRKQFFIFTLLNTALSYLFFWLLVKAAQPVLVDLFWLVLDELENNPLEYGNLYDFDILMLFDPELVSAALADHIVSLPLIVVSLILFLSFCFLLTIPTIAITCRRLHDAGFSGFVILIGLIPVLGGLGLLVLMLMPSAIDGNSYRHADQQHSEFPIL